MREERSTSELVQGLQAGSEQAATEVFVRYAQRLVRLAEQHLSRRVAARLDGEDVVQSVFRTFFRRAAAGEFRIDSAQQMWRLLVKITVLKARAKERQQRAGMRDVAAEMAPGGVDWLAEAAARDPGPLEAAAFVEQIETLVEGLPSLHAQVLEMRLQGTAVAEIASNLKLSRQTIYRVLHLLQERLERSAGSQS